MVVGNVYGDLSFDDGTQIDANGFAARFRLDGSFDDASSVGDTEALALGAGRMANGWIVTGGVRGEDLDDDIPFRTIRNRNLYEGASDG